MESPILTRYPIRPLGCASETGTLQRIIIHSPDDGIEQITPDKAVEYLYEDIVYLDKMKHEHTIFQQLLECFVGKENVIDIQILLEEILHSETVKTHLINAVIQFEHQLSLKERLTQLSPADLAYTCITGILEGKSVFAPASNFIFCRDIGVMINDHLLVTQAMKRARCRESLLSYFIYNYHPVFSHQQTHQGIIQLSLDTEELLENISKAENELSIEGGDVMMIAPDHVMIGCSERTSRYAIEKVMQQLFAKKVVQSVTVVEMPKERYCMHLDTIFTIIDCEVSVVFAPLILEAGKLKIKTYHSISGKPIHSPTLKDLMLSNYPEMKFIPCGGGISPYAEREQWTDGCNLFALKPGVAVTYDRNERTAKAIASFGYEIAKAEDIIAQIQSSLLDPSQIQKTLIIIPSNELSRARGGTHCLTFPIGRGN